MSELPAWAVWLIDHANIIGGAYLILLSSINTTHINKKMDEAFDEDYGETDPGKRISTRIRMLEMRHWSLGWSFIGAIGVVLLFIRPL